MGSCYSVDILLKTIFTGTCNRGTTTEVQPWSVSNRLLFSLDHLPMSLGLGHK